MGGYGKFLGQKKNRYVIGNGKINSCYERNINIAVYILYEQYCKVIVPNASRTCMRYEWPRERLMISWTTSNRRQYNVDNGISGIVSVREYCQ